MSADKKPVKGILKPSTSFDKEGHPSRQDKEKEMKWDEMNILATYHPADKDYGHRKIDEPPTPYNRTSESEGEEDNTLDAERLASSLTAEAAKPKVMTKVESSEDDEEDDEQLTEEEKAKKREFEKRRKMHYNEFQAVQLARQLLETDDNEDEDTPGESMVDPAPARTDSDMALDEAASEMDTTEPPTDCQDEQL